MADYIDGSSSEQAGISRRSLIKKGMMAGGVGLWAVPVLAIVTRNGASEGGTGVTQNVAPADHGGPTVSSCGVAGSGPGCITFVCLGTLTHCAGTYPAGLTPADGRPVCFCDTDIHGICRCFANANCSTLANCPNLGAPNGGCQPLVVNNVSLPTFCVNPFTCCGVAKCAPVCA